MIAHIVDSRLVLEHYDQRCEEGFQGPSQTTNITKPVQNAVHFARNGLQVAIQLVSHSQLRVVFEVVQTQRSRSDLEQFKDLAISANRAYLVTEVQLNQVHVVVDVDTDLG